MQPGTVGKILTCHPPKDPPHPHPDRPHPTNPCLPVQSPPPKMATVLSPTAWPRPDWTRHQGIHSFFSFHFLKMSCIGPGRNLRTVSRMLSSSSSSSPQPRGMAFFGRVSEPSQACSIAAFSSASFSSFFFSPYWRDRGHRGQAQDYEKVMAEGLRSKKARLSHHHEHHHHLHTTSLVHNCQDG